MTVTVTVTSRGPATPARGRRVALCSVLLLCLLTRRWPVVWYGMVLGSIMRSALGWKWCYPYHRHSSSHNHVTLRCCATLHNRSGSLSSPSTLGESWTFLYTGLDSFAGEQPPMAKNRTILTEPDHQNHIRAAPHPFQQRRAIPPSPPNYYVPKPGRTPPRGASTTPARPTRCSSRRGPSTPETHPSFSTTRGPWDSRASAPCPRHNHIRRI